MSEVSRRGRNWPQVRRPAATVPPKALASVAANSVINNNVAKADTESAHANPEPPVAASPKKVKRKAAPSAPKPVPSPEIQQTFDDKFVICMVSACRKRILSYGLDLMTSI